MSASLVFRVWRESRVTQVLLEVLVFLVWMDVTEPEERGEILDLLENLDPMENRVFQVQRAFQESNRSTSHSTLEYLETLG